MFKKTLTKNEFFNLFAPVEREMGERWPTTKVYCTPQNNDYGISDIIFLQISSDWDQPYTEVYYTDTALFAAFVLKYYQ